MMRVTAILLSLLATGCISQHQSYVANVDAQEWCTPARIAVPNSDTLSARQLDIFVRYTDEFAADSLTLIITTLTPDTLLLRERVSFRLGRRESPAALAQLQTLHYRDNVVLSRSGVYNFYIRPAHPYGGVEAIGVNIQTNKL